MKFGDFFFLQINSENDRGILKGRWEGPFWGGVAPSHWNGSHTILKQWFNRGCYPVKYGQCWVFAGVMCSGDDIFDAEVIVSV